MGDVATPKLLIVVGGDEDLLKLKICCVQVGDEDIYVGAAIMKMELDVVVSSF